MAEGTPEIGKFFSDVRLLCGHAKIGSFADLLKLDGAHLGRIESGARLPGADALDKLYPYIVQAQRDPSALLYLWLEAQGLDKFVHELRRPKKKRAS